MAYSLENYRFISSHVGVIQGYTNCGVIKSGTSLYLIDSGTSDKDGEEIKTVLDTLFPNCKLKAIINTHSHADHCGGNSYLKKATDCETWCSKQDATMMSFPIVVDYIYWGGYPPEELRKLDFGLFGEIKADRIFGEEIIELEDVSIECVKLNGHYFDQLGYLITDKETKTTTYFLGDAFFGASLLKKYWIPFMLNPEEFRQSIGKIEQSTSQFYVPSHGLVCTNDQMKALAELNLMITYETESLITKMLTKQEMTFEEILKSIADYSRLELKSSQYILIGCTIKSYLSSMSDRHLIRSEISQNKLYWSINS